MELRSLGRLIRTLSWLRREQFIGRLRYYFHRPQPDMSPPPPRRSLRGAWQQPPAREPSLLGPKRWRLLSVTWDLEEIGWDHPSVDLLWRYNQHYFDDLNAAGASQRRAWHDELLNQWQIENPPSSGTGWAPYPTSLRIVNLIKASFTGLPLDASRLHSLAVQVRWLCEKLEWHLLGNHLFSNAKALVLAGLFFDGDEAAGWLALGLRILHQELPEQFLGDGAQFERSPMYQSLAVEDLLDLLNGIRCLAPSDSPARALEAELGNRAVKGLDWLAHMVLGDGRLSHFNDSADGIAPSYEDLCCYAGALGIQLPGQPIQGQRLLQPSGYVSWREGNALLIADVAPIGPDYLPGHAHADTLSFELCLGSQPVIVNRGTSVYGSATRRQIERGTAAHSTLQIDDHNSSEVWSGFRVGRRAYPQLLVADGCSLEAQHNGFTHLRGRPLHRRRWILGERELEVTDWHDGHPEARALVRYHLAPGLRLHRQGALWQAIDSTGGICAVAHVELGEAAIEFWDHAQCFGLLTPAQTLVIHLGLDRQARVRWIW